MIRDLKPYIGIPYVAGAFGPDGADCYGLIRLLFQQELGVGLPGYGDFSAPDNAATARAVQSNALDGGGDWTQVPVGQEAVYDAVIFRVGALPCHVGVVSRAGYMLHSLAGSNSTEESYRSLRWRSRLIGFYRHLSLTPKS